MILPITGSWKNLFLAIGVVLIVLIGAYLRLDNLRINPPWYPDEGDNVNVSRNLVEGRQRYFALDGPTILEGRPPAYHLLSAMAFQVWGDDLLSLRIVSALSGILAIGLLFVLGSQVFEAPLAFLAAALLAFYPSAVINSRYAFSYNLLSPLVIVNLWAIALYFRTGRRKYLVMAALAVGLATVTDFVGFGLIGADLLLLLLSRKREIFWAALIMLAPFAIYLVIMLASNSSAFLADLSFIFLHGFSDEPLLLRLLLFPLFYPQMFQWDWWTLVGIAGVFTVSKGIARSHMLIMLAAMFFMLIRVGSFADTSFHRFIPAFPLITIGVASLLMTMLPILIKIVNGDVQRFVEHWRGVARSLHVRWVNATAVSLVISFFVLTPFVGSAFFDFVFLKQVFPTGLERVTANKAKDVFAVAAFLNERLDDGDVVVASPQINWLIHGNVLDFKQSVASKGLPPYPSDIDEKRWAFNPSYEKARYIVLDNFTLDFIAGLIPGMKTIIPEVERWQLVFEMGEYRVYENPAGRP